MRGVVEIIYKTVTESGGACKWAYFVRIWPRRWGLSQILSLFLVLSVTGKQAEGLDS